MKREELFREGWRLDGIRQKKKGLRGRFKMPGATMGILSHTCSGCLADSVELAEFPACFSLLATFFYTWFFVEFTTLQLSFYPIYLQLLLQLSDGIFKVSSNFNFYHLGLRLTN